MKTYELHMTSRFIDPTFLVQMRGSGGVKATIQDDGSVTVYGERMVFADEAVAIEPGTEVEVYLGYRNFHCSTLADIEAHLSQVRAKEMEEKERERIRRNDYRDESIAFNASIQIPVKWEPGVKDVLSGLSANSCGDGRNRATVEHVLLNEDLKVGRLLRKEGDFLCSNSQSRWGAGWRDSKEEWFDGDGNPYKPKVTCRACLSIIERMRKAAMK
jgi:hypothetical protein